MFRRRRWASTYQKTGPEAVVENGGRSRRPRRPADPQGCRGERDAPEDKQPTLQAVQELRPEYAEAIAAYRPYRTDERTWEATQEVVRAMLAAYRLPSLYELKTKACHMVAFAAWVWKRPEHGAADLDLTLAEVAAPGLIEVYLAGPLADSPESTKATARCAIRRALRGLSTTPQPDKYRRTALKPPYSPAECAGFVRLARNQPTKGRRRAVSALVGLGLGAGLDGRDQKR